MNRSGFWRAWYLIVLFCRVLRKFLNVFFHPSLFRMTKYLFENTCASVFWRSMVLTRRVDDTYLDKFPFSQLPQTDLTGFLCLLTAGPKLICFYFKTSSRISFSLQTNFFITIRFEEASDRSRDWELTSLESNAYQ